MNPILRLHEKSPGLARVLVVVGTLLAVFGLTRLSFEDLPRNFFRSEGEAFRLLEEVFEDFGSDDGDFVLVLEADDVFTPETARVVRELGDALLADPGLQDVTSLATIVLPDQGLLPRRVFPDEGASEGLWQAARSRALTHPFTVGQLVSADGRTTLVVARLADDTPAIHRLLPVLDRVESIAGEATEGTGVRARVTGLPALRVVIFESLRREQVRFIACGAALTAFIAFCLFRSLAEVLIVSLTSVLGAVWTLGALGLSGQSINILTSVLPTLVMVIGFTDTVHLMLATRRRRMRGMTPRAAAVDAVRHLTLACVVTSLTTAVGFLSLATGSLPMIRNFGIVCALGVTLTLFCVLLVFPVMVPWFARFMRAPEPEPDVGREVLGEGILKKVLQHPWRVSIAGTLITAFALWTAFHARADSHISESLPAGTESSEALQVVDRDLGGLLPVYVLVDHPPGVAVDAPELRVVLEGAEELLRQRRALSNPLSIHTLAHGNGNASAVWSQLVLNSQDERFVALRRQWVNPAKNRLAVIARLQDIGSAASEPIFRDLEHDLADLERNHPGYRLRLTGSSVVAGRAVQEMIRDLARGLLLAAIVIFVVMCAALRSLRLGLVSILPNVFPLAVTAACLVWFGQPLRLTGVIVFSICLGLAVDDTVHFLTAYRNERLQGVSELEAIHRSYRTVGLAILITTLALLGGFGIMLWSVMTSLQLFAWMSGVGLASAFVGDVIILPALLVVSRRRPRRS